ncbi:MAG: choice-of-anchor D domain-containing protein, partial [Candidatus Acidiferrales bacterium]
DTDGDQNFQPVQVGVTGVAVDLVGQVYLSGFTSQPGAGFPTTNGLQAAYGGGAFDGFLMCFSTKGLGVADLIYSTFLGGSGSDQALGVAVDGAIPANAYVAGITQSSNIINSPTISGYQTALGGAANGFLAVVSQSVAGVTSLNYATYFGGSGTDSALSVYAVGENAVYLSGHNTSPNFPTYQSLQAFSGTSDAFVAKFDTTQSGVASLLYSTLLGGGADAQGNGIAATANGGVFVSGNTTSLDFPRAGNPQTGFQPTCVSCQESPPLSDAFLVALQENSTTGPIVSFNAPELNFGNQLDGSPNPPELSILTNAGTVPLEISSLGIFGTNASDFSQSNNCPISPQMLAAGTTCSITVTFSPSAAGAESAALSFTDNAANSPQGVDLVGTGQEPVVSASPQAISFGNQSEGTTSNGQYLTITNSGNLSLQISNVSVVGADTSAFKWEFSGSSVGGACPYAPTGLLPGGYCTYEIYFSPQAPRTYNAQFQFTDNTGNQPGTLHSIPLSGMGVPPSAAVNLAPTSLIFTSQIVGTTSGPQSVTMTNTGSLALQISTISLAGTNASAFSTVSNCPSNSGTLGAGAQCTVNVTFTPSSLGPQTASISFSDNVSGSPQIVSLSGTGVSASLSVLPAGIGFSPQTLQIPAANQSVIISNNGTVPVQISSVAVGGADTADFTATPNCPGTLNPPSESKNSSCQVSVQFHPTAGGPRSANLSIVDDAAGSPQVVTLAGMGLVPTVALPGTSPSFNTQLVGTTSVASPIAITNTGNGALSISSLTLSGTNSGDFQQTSTCVDNPQHTNMIPAGATCAVNVTFLPQAAGARAAALNIADNAPASPQTMALSGAAVDYSVGVAPGAPQSIVVTAGQTANYNLQVSPLGGFTGAVNLTCSGAPELATCSISTPAVNITGASAVGFSVSVVTTAASASSPSAIFRVTPGRSSRDFMRRIRAFPRFVFGFMAILLLIAGASATRSIWRVHALVTIPALCLAILFILVGCGGGGGGGGAQTTSTLGTPAGIYTLTVTGTVQSVTRTVPLTLEVQ